MLEASIGKFTYDSANRLITADTRYYVYDVEGTRIKTQKGEDTTKFTYNVNARLSQLLIKTENNAETKYVYGLGLIGEEVSGNFKTYHFDYRGSTVAITDSNCNITDTFEYDTYGKLKSRTGTTKTPFLYNGRDGVMYEDDTGLIYMRARYYSPILRRFVNADKVHGDITNALTLNRYAFVNGNPAVNVDPEGLSAERGNVSAGKFNTVAFGNGDVVPNVDTIGLITEMVNSPGWDVFRAYFGSEYTALTMIDVIYDNMKANNDQLTLINTFKKIVGYLPDAGSVSNGLASVISLGPNGNITYSVNVKGGNGNINVSAVYSEQIKLASTFSFQTNGVGVSYTPSSKNSALRYSCPITDSTTISASVSGVPGTSLSANYTITTECGDNNSMYTSVGINYYNKPQDPKSKGQRHTSLNMSSDTSTTAVLVCMGFAAVAAMGAAGSIAVGSAGRMKAPVKCDLKG